MLLLLLLFDMRRSGHVIIRAVVSVSNGRSTTALCNAGQQTPRPKHAASKYVVVQRDTVTWFVNIYFLWNIATGSFAPCIFNRELSRTSRHVGEGALASHAVFCRGGQHLKLLHMHLSQESSVRNRSATANLGVMDILQTLQG